MSIDRLIAYERLTPPGKQLGVLVEPPADIIATLATSDHTPTLHSAALLDTTIATLRDRLRQRLELTTPAILTGHQVEFVHAGVFAKTIAADALAADLSGTAAHLTVDSDLPKTTRLIVPRVERGEVRRVPIAIPGCDPRLATEWQPRLPAARWRSFFDRVSELAGDEYSLLPSFLEGVFQNRNEDLSLADVIDRGNGSAGRVLGLAEPRRLRVSQLSRTPEFRALLAHLVLNASSFAQSYNDAREAYRSRRSVRNPHRPVRSLSTAGDRVELPVWISRAGGQRRRLAVARQDDRIALFADDQPLGSEPLATLRSAANHAEPWQVEREGWHLRPRALLLSAFARLLLADLFVHGVGGARYDEMAEDFVRRFWGAELPPAICVSATAYLPLPRHGVGRRALGDARHALRDVRFNPQRHLPNLPPPLLERRTALVQASDRLRQGRRSDRAERRRVFNEIRAINRELLRHDTEQTAALKQRCDLLERQHRSDQAACDREYFFALHSRRTMESLTQTIRNKMSKTKN